MKTYIRAKTRSRWLSEPCCSEGSGVEEKSRQREQILKKGGGGGAMKPVRLGEVSEEESIREVREV